MVTGRGDRDGPGVAGLLAAVHAVVRRAHPAEGILAGEPDGGGRGVPARRMERARGRRGRRRRRRVEVERAGPSERRSVVAPALGPPVRPAVVTVGDDRSVAAAEIPVEHRPGVRGGQGLDLGAGVVPDGDGAVERLGCPDDHPERVEDVVAVGPDERARQVVVVDLGGRAVGGGERVGPDVAGQAAVERPDLDHPRAVGQGRRPGQESQRAAGAERGGGARQRRIGEQVGRADRRRGTGHDQPGRDGVGRGIGRPGDHPGRQRWVIHDRVVVRAFGDAGRVHDDLRPGRPERIPGDVVAVVAGHGVEQRAHRGRAREQPVDVGHVGVVGVRNHRPGARREEPGAEVVDPRLLVGERAGRQPGLGVAGRITQVEEEDHGVRGESDLRSDLGLAVVDVGRAVGAAHGVQPQAVLGVRPERIAILRRPAVAMSQVDQDRGALGRRLDRRPGGLRGLDQDDVVGVLAGGPGDGVGVGLVVGVVRADRPDDDHDLGVDPGTGSVDRRGQAPAHRQHGSDRQEGRAEGAKERSHDRRPRAGLMHVGETFAQSGAKHHEAEGPEPPRTKAGPRRSEGD